MNLLDQQTEAWTRYVDARRKADRTLKMTDGIAAAKAWNAFLDVFLAEEKALSSSSKVIQFPETRQ